MTAARERAAQLSTYLPAPRTAVVATLVPFQKIAPATGTLVRGGLNYREALYVAEACAETGRLGSMDLVEVNADLAEASAAEETVQLGLVAVASAMGSRIL